MSSVALQVLANGDANSPAMERLTQLVRECLALSAGMAVANPKGTFAFHSLNMDAAAPSNAEEAPGPDYWARIVVSPHLAFNIRSLHKLSVQFQLDVRAEKPFLVIRGSYCSWE